MNLDKLMNDLTIKRNQHLDQLLKEKYNIVLSFLEKRKFIIRREITDPNKINIEFTAYNYYLTMPGYSNEFLFSEIVKIGFNANEPVVFQHLINDEQILSEKQFDLYMQKKEGSI